MHSTSLLGLKTISPVRCPAPSMLKISMLTYHPIDPARSTQPSDFQHFPTPPFNPFSSSPEYSTPPPLGYGYTQTPPPLGSSYTHNPPPPAPTFSTPNRQPVPRSSDTPTPRASRTAEVVVLEEGFAWDRESLALLCKWKEVGKKGSVAAAHSGKFPGKTAVDLDFAWATHRAEARRYYEEVYGKSLNKD